MPNYQKLQLLQELQDLYPEDIYMLNSDKGIFSDNIEFFEDKENFQILHKTTKIKSIIKIRKKTANLLGVSFKKIDKYFPPIQDPSKKKMLLRICMQQRNNNIKDVRHHIQNTNGKYIPPSRNSLSSTQLTTLKYCIHL